VPLIDDSTMEDFSYQRTDDAAAAVRAVAEVRGAQFIGGGTTLVDLMKLNVQPPSRVVDINHLPLANIEFGAQSIRIGAMVRNSDLAYHGEIQKRYPVLSQALLSGATPQIRNMATVGGNLLQRTRCPYFRDIVWPCNKREPDSGCSAIDGINRTHAILGTSEKCIATHPSDMCVALTALDATIHTRSAHGERSIPMSDFYVAYGEDPAKENVLEHGALISGVEIRTVDWFARSHYLKIRDRASFEFALCSAAVALNVEGGKIRDVRLALGGVATKPWRADAAEKLLTGERPSEKLFAQAADAALADARPQKHNSFKIELMKRTIARALNQVASMS
jgi:xanthine dehydrogenase YagS FAD-binding subunit